MTRRGARNGVSAPREPLGVDGDALAWRGPCYVADIHMSPWQSPLRVDRATDVFLVMQTQLELAGCLLQ
jgi:hypothetical protein